jgi:hypothetical protein
MNLSLPSWKVEGGRKEVSMVGCVMCGGYGTQISSLATCSDFGENTIQRITIMATTSDSELLVF